MNWRLSLFPSAPVRQGGTGLLIEGPSAQPTPMSRDWPGLVSLLTTFRRYPGRHPELPADKKGRRADCWSPARYEPNERRRKASRVIEVSCLVYDFDDGTEPGDAIAAFRDWWMVGHTSWSHGVGGKAAFRVVLPLLEPVPGEQWPRAWAAAQKLWGGRKVSGGEPDPKCKDSSRIYYLPAWRAGQSDRFAWSHPGAAGLLHLDWRREPAISPPPPYRPMERVAVPWGRMDAEIRRRLNREPDARANLGRALGGAVGERVTGIPCPQCSRRDVWWLVNPAKAIRAECNHRNSCGWTGYLADLAAACGVSL